MPGRARPCLLLAIVFVVGSCSPHVRKPPTTFPTGTPPESRLRFAAVGDIGDGSANEAAVAAAIAREHVRDPLDLLVLLGDLIYPNGNPADYQQKFAEPYRQIIEAGIETEAVIGNHDIETDPSGMLAAFNMPSRYYSFRRGALAFFALDSSRGNIDDGQLAWLEQELSRTSGSWKIVLTHVPMYSSGIHGSTTDVRGTLEDLLADHGVALVIAAHDHDYERTTPIKGIVHLVVGTGCCPRPGPMFSNPFTASFQVGLGFLLAEASESELQIQWIDVEGRVRDRATLPATVRDQAA